MRSIRFLSDRGLLMRQTLAAWLVLSISTVLFASSASVLSLAVHSERTAIIISLILVSPLSVTAHILLQKRDYYLTSPARERRRDARILEEANVTSVGTVEPMARIKVVGVGGAGSNAVGRMIEANLGGVEFIAVNTDLQSLLLSSAPTRVHIGGILTRGMGCGGDRAIGARAAKRAGKELTSVLKGADMVFIVAGMGGGTGTGASPIVAQIAHALGALTVAVVTRPFSFEGVQRARVAEEGLRRLATEVDTLIVIQNDRLLQLMGRETSVRDAFLMADSIIHQSVKGVSELITANGLINTDFGDVAAIMSAGGPAVLRIGRASGEERALAAVQQAMSSSLIDTTISGATGVLLNFKGGQSLSLFEVAQAAELIRQTAAPDANIIFGTVLDEQMKDEVEVTIIATGFGSGSETEIEPVAPVAEEAKPLTPVQRLFQKEDPDIGAFLRR